MARDIVFRRAVVEQPLTRDLGIGQRLGGAERLGGDDEQRALGIHADQRVVEIRRVHVGHEMTVDALAQLGERIADQARAEIRAADADVDDVADRRAGVAEPAPATDIVDELGHRRAHRVDLVVQRRVVGPAQGHVPGRPPLAVVDRRAGEQGRARGVESLGLGQPAECAHHRLVDALLGIVERDARRREREALRACRIVREHGIHARPAHLRREPAQIAPGRLLTDVEIGHAACTGMALRVCVT